jgi:protein-S-isoprenylcysteine O-methyltransferase Ste14
LHSLFASTGFKIAAAKRMGKGSRHYRLYYTLFAFLTLAAIFAYQLSMHNYFFYRLNILLYIAGSVMVLAGLAIMAVCIAKYFFQLSGLKALMQEQHSDTLMITGIHRKMRHPLYTGTFIFIWGLFVLFPAASLLIADLVITIYTLIGIRFEERKLILAFGEAYVKYKKEVPMLIPRF